MCLPGVKKRRGTGCCHFQHLNQVLNIINRQICACPKISNASNDFFGIPHAKLDTALRTPIDGQSMRWKGMAYAFGMGYLLWPRFGKWCVDHSQARVMGRLVVFAFSIEGALVERKFKIYQRYTQSTSDLFFLQNNLITSEL